MTHLASFEFEGKVWPVRFEETQTVTVGVVCDLYSFINDVTKDLAIVRVAPGCKTPLQRVRLGKRTIEVFVRGNGALMVRSGDERQTYGFHEGEVARPVAVEVGQIMQWEADDGLVG